MRLTATEHPETAADFDPLDPETVRDPHATYARLREGCPVARGERWGGFWALTRYDDVVAASTDARTFSSAEGIVVPRNVASGRRAPMHYDPPEHTRYRRAVNPAFHDERVGELEPEIRRLAGDVLRPVIARGGGDLIADFASPLSTLALCLLLNIPEDDAALINESSVRFERAQIDQDHETVETENAWMYDYARRMVSGRRAAPMDPDQDMVSGLLAVGDGGIPIEDEQVAGTARQLFIAGHVAVYCALGSAIAHLARDPDLQQKLRREPARIDDAVEELLRLYSPNQGFARTATRDVEIRDRPIRAGEQVAFVYTSANRDGRTFPGPDEFVLGRRPNRHLAFGHGVHKCPGAPLARAEMRIAVEELLARTADFRIDGEVAPEPWPMYGPATLPVRCEEARDE